MVGGLFFFSKLSRSQYYKTFFCGALGTRRLVIMTLCIVTLSITIKNTALSIKETRH
jgi:hypothetical protein